jgi:hypothetical protein
MDRWALVEFAEDRGYDIFQFQMLKYLDRWREKGGLQDLEKMHDYLTYYRNREEGRTYTPSEEERLHGHNKL